jgi:hypothetical protein
VTAPADLDVLRRVLQETGVDQTAPDPSWSAYLYALLEAFAAWLERRLPSLHGLRDLPTRLGLAMGLVAIALVIVVLLVVARATWRSRRDAVRPVPASARTIPAATPVPERDRDGWRREIERCLATADLAAALEALWWWFARALTTARVDPAWTSHELLAHTQRRELGALAFDLDRLLYGAARPRAADIHAFLSRAEDVLT